MKRIFDSDKEIDMIVNEYTKETGVKIGKIFNNAIYNWFLPNVETLYVEAKYILDLEEKGELSQDTIKQCLSRGITWLGKYPIRNCEVLRSILLHFTCASFFDRKEDSRNNYVKEMFKKAEEKIKEHNPNYDPFHNCIGNYGEDICDNWENIWEEKIMYDVISSIVYLEEPKRPFTWFEAINYLCQIEYLAQKKYGVK